MDFVRYIYQGQLSSVNLDPLSLKSSWHGENSQHFLAMPRPRTQGIYMQIAHHNFTDHASSPSLCVYRGNAPANSTPVLPPLFNFSVYVTYGVTLESAPSDLATRILRAIHGSNQPEKVRCDIYFLPGASVQAMVTHYRGERAAAVERNGPDRVGVPHGPLPDYTHNTNWSKGFALVLDSADWEGEAGVRMLRFEPPKEMMEEEDREERWAMLGDTDAEGVNLSKGMQVWDEERVTSNALGPSLAGFFVLEWSWDIEERYQQALQEGRSSW